MQTLHSCLLMFLANRSRVIAISNPAGGSGIIVVCITSADDTASSKKKVRGASYKIVCSLPWGDPDPASTPGPRLEAAAIGVPTDRVYHPIVSALFHPQQVLLWDRVPKPLPPEGANATKWAYTGVPSISSVAA